MAHAFCDLGHRVTVIATRSSEKIPAEREANGIHVQRLLVRDLYRLRRLPILGRYVRSAQQLLYSVRVNRALRELFLRDPFDMVEFAEVNAEGFFYARNPLTPFVVRCHTPTFILKNYYTAREMPYDTAIISRAEKFLIRCASVLTAPSRDMARVISETTGVPLDRVAVVPNALTLTDFQLPNNSSPQHSNKITVLFVGRLERVKGVEVLAKAIPSVMGRVPAAHFVFVGDDLKSARGKSQRAELENYLSETNAHTHVEFVGGVDQATLLEWYRRADICVVPSLLYESFSYAAAQAMALGKPVIASRIGGIPETVDEGVNAILCDPDNAERLSDALVRLASDRDMRIAFGRAGRAKVEREFDAKKIAQRYVTLFSELISKKC